MTLHDVLNTARDALNAQQFGLTVTGQNVANANTPGYVRREAVLTSRVLGGRSYGSVEASLRRTADQFAIQRHLAATGLSSAAAERDSQLSTIETLFNDFEGSGLGQSINELYSSFNDLATSPTNLAVRSTVLSKADSFATRAREVSGQLEQSRTDLFQTARSLVGEINQTAADIAALNEQIGIAVASGQDAADLKDRRAQALEGLAQLVDIDILAGENEQLTVHATGTTLVEGKFSRQLAVDIDASNAIEVRSGLAGNATTNVTKFLQGGELAGVVEVRDRDIVAIAEGLDQLVFDVASSINGQHAGGFGLDGSSGLALFSLSASASDAAASLQVSADLRDRPDRLAASGDALTLPGGGDNALRLSQLVDSLVAGGNSQTPVQAYASLVSDVGRRKNQAEGDLATRQAITEQSLNLRDSVSGVSLDEEMIALTKFQRAFQAASQVLSVVDEMMQDLLSIR